MSYIPFELLPDSSRLWIFASDHVLSDAETEMLSAEMKAFCNSWLAHQQPVTGSAMMIYNQFLLVAADSSTFPTGCSTDEMMRRVRMIGETYGVEFFGMPRVQFRDGAEIKTMTRIEFDSLAKDLSRESIVFDNTLTSLAAFREGKWELPAKDAWHIRAFEFAK